MILNGHAKPVRLLTWSVWLTAGIWRRKTIEAVGGWNSRTTVEDMDLSLRTYLAGWKAVFLKDVTCLNEVIILLLPYNIYLVLAYVKFLQPPTSCADMHCPGPLDESLFLYLDAALLHSLPKNNDTAF